MHAQNCLFRAIECSNRAHSDLDKLMEALFFIRCGGLAQKSLGAALRPRRAQGCLRRQVPALAPSPQAGGGVGACRRGRHHSPRLLAQEQLTPAAPAQSC